MFRFETGVEYLNGIKDWDGWDTIPLLQFRFDFVMPRPRKERKIILRDSIGRIVKSKPYRVSRVNF